MNDLYSRVPPGTVPDANSTENSYLRDAVGNKSDNSFSNVIGTGSEPSVLGHLRANYYHIHDRAKVYPSGYGAITAEAIGAAGTGYVALEVVTAVQTGGSDATFTIDTVGASGEVTAVTRLTAGTGYETAAGVTTTGGSGTGLTLDLTTDYEYGKAPIELTAGASAWLHGVKTEVVPTNGIASVFDIHWVIASNASAAADYELRVYSGLSGSEEEIARVAFSRNAVADRSAAEVPVQIPPRAANTRISMSLACSSVSETCHVKIYYHNYPDIT